METTSQPRRKLASTKKIELPEHPEFSITVGTEDRDRPTCTWIQITTWLISEESVIKRDISKLNKEIRQELWDGNDLVFDCKRLMCNVSYPEFLKYERNSTPHFLSIDLTTFQRDMDNLLDWKDYNLQMYLQWYAEEVIKILKSKEGFQFTKKRRKKNDLKLEC